MKIIRVGVDLAKSVFQVHGVDRSEKPVLRRKLSRKEWLKFLTDKLEPGCEIGMEACCGAHHWARQLQSEGIQGKAHCAAVCEAVREEQQERRQRCGSHLRSDEPAEHAIRSDQDHGPTRHPGRAPHSFRIDRTAHGQGQPDKRADGRAWTGRPGRSRNCGRRCRSGWKMARMV